MIYFQIGGGESQKHFRDIGGMVKLLAEKLDRAYIAQWAERLGVSNEWQLTLNRLSEPDA